MGFTGHIGGLFALMTASVVLSMGFNWRYAFIFGAFVAVIGVFSRLKLRETPEFLNYKLRIAKKAGGNNQKPQMVKNTSFDDEKINKKTILAFALTEFHNPIGFYIAIVYLSGFMKNSLGMTLAQVATHNLKVLVFSFIGILIVIYLVKRMHPVKIAMAVVLLFVIGLPFIPYWLDIIVSIGNSEALFSLFCIQSLILLLAQPAYGTLDAIQYKYFPINKRFTTVATTSGIASTLPRVLIIFSLIPLTHYFGYYALWFIFTPAVVGYL